MDSTGTREGKGGWDRSRNDQYYEAKKSVKKEGILLIGSARHVAKGENLLVGDLTKYEVHCERWRELAKFQNRMECTMLL